MNHFQQIIDYFSWLKTANRIVTWNVLYICCAYHPLVLVCHCYSIVYEWIEKRKINLPFNYFLQPDLIITAPTTTVLPVLSEICLSRPWLSHRYLMLRLINSFCMLDSIQERTKKCNIRLSAILENFYASGINSEIYSALDYQAFLKILGLW